MLAVKDSLFLKIKKHQKCQAGVMDLISHRGIALELFDRSVIRPVCLHVFGVYQFESLHSMA